LARKILLADDSVTAQNMGRKILTDAGYDVITVNNGSAALKRVAELKPDLIVLDVYMPGYSGLEVCVRLKDAPETARIPILLTVGKLEPFKPEEATRVRADAFIVKPFEASELLSALTRLEDRMVPSQSEGGRFGGSSTGIERFGGGDSSAKQSESDDSDTGWKNRLRFPSKKKKEEPEPEPEPDFVTPSSFRDFRRGGGKAPAGSAQFPLSTAPAAAQAPAVVPDIPRDITPEELDALSELAAKLDGVPAPETVAPSSEPASPEVATAPEVHAESSAPPALPQETNPEAAAAAVELVEIKNESEIRASDSGKEAIVDAAETRNAFAVEAAQPPVEAAPVDVPVAETVVFKTEAAIAQEPAPVDREDEPMFASAVNAVTEAEPVAETAASEPSIPPAEPAVVESAIEIEPPSEAEEPIVQGDPQAEERSAAAAANPTQTNSLAESSPSAEELAEALRFLTPAQTPAVPQTLAEAGAALAQELARGNGSHWVAEGVPLSPEEAAGSLEAEMFRTFAPSAVEPPSSPDASTAPSAVAEPAAESTAGPVSAPEYRESEPEKSSANQVEEVNEEPVAATTFADAVRDQDVESVSANAEAATSEAAAEAHRHDEISTSENGPGGEEAMGKETKGKSGKWHQIHPGAPAAASDAVEAAKQSEGAPKTMAAAASADGASDASHIASIVDSVLADLRPKIVEEIAKQLAKK
jgi:CheY-like chemotaxis protein